MSVFIALSGLPGVGKSTIAKALAVQTGALWLRVDEIEQSMRGSAHAPDDLADLGYRALCGSAACALRQGTHVIGDMVNPIAETRAVFQAMSASVPARHLDVVLRCSDKEEHRRRVEARRMASPNQALPKWADVEARAWEDFETADLTLDTAEVSVEMAVQAVAVRMEG